MPEPLDKQIRLRCTADEKNKLETATSDAGYANLSDFLRHVLFDENVLIVGDSNTRFTLVPAYSSIEAEREEAIANLQGLLRLAEMARQIPDSTPVGEASPEAPEPVAVPADVDATRGAEPPAAAPVDVGPVAEQPVAAPPHLAPVPDPPSGPTGPRPHPEETYDAFLERRSGELILAGSTALRAGLEADAEWRANLGEAVEPQPEQPVVADGGQTGHGFCGQCGAPLAGTPFCGKCGTPTGVA